MPAHPSLPLAASLVAALVSSGALADPALPACEGLAALSLPDTPLTVAAPVAAGTMPPIDTAACRVAGAVNYGGIADALRRGHAGGSTDTEHVGGTADFGWRGKLLQAVRSKDIVKAFYGRPAKHAYFSSCSNGGRQALMEIQRFAGNYDGVSEDPRRCHFDLASLACPAGTDAPGASVQGFFGNAFFGRVVHEIPAPVAWDFSTFGVHGDLITADIKTAFNFNATGRGQ
jgi:Tannase and feruloyl esterase